MLHKSISSINLENICDIKLKPKDIIDAYNIDLLTKSISSKGKGVIDGFDIIVDENTVTINKGIALIDNCIIQYYDNFTFNIEDEIDKLRYDSNNNEIFDNIEELLEGVEYIYLILHYNYDVNNIDNYSYFKLVRDIDLFDINDKTECILYMFKVLYEEDNNCLTYNLEDFNNLGYDSYRAYAIYEDNVLKLYGNSSNYYSNYLILTHTVNDPVSVKIYIEDGNTSFDINNVPSLIFIDTMEMFKIVPLDYEINNNTYKVKDQILEVELRSWDVLRFKSSLENQYFKITKIELCYLDVEEENDD